MSCAVMDVDDILMRDCGNLYDEYLAAVMRCAELPLSTEVDAAMAVAIDEVSRDLRGVTTAYGSALVDTAVCDVRTRARNIVYTVLGHPSTWAWSASASQLYPAAVSRNASSCAESRPVHESRYFNTLRMLPRDAEAGGHWRRRFLTVLDVAYANVFRAMPFP